MAEDLIITSTDREEMYRQLLPQLEALAEGEKVYVEDLIEETGSEGRYATWNGKELEFLQ